jgi:hypothetical protein
MRPLEVLRGVMGALLLSVGLMSLVALQSHGEPLSETESARNSYYWRLLEGYDRAHPSPLTGNANICASLIKQYGGSPETCAGTLPDREWVLNYTSRDPVPQFQRVGVGNFSALLTIGGAIVFLTTAWILARHFQLRYEASEARRRKVTTAEFRVNDSPINQCIGRARAMKLRIAEEELAVLSVKWQNPVSGVTLIDRHANARTILKQTALLPIASMLILILVLLTPFIYLSDLRKLARKRAMLKAKVRVLRTSPLPLDEPSVRTLRDLWSHHGLDGEAARSKIALDLLCQWVDFLYGSGRSAELKILERAREIGRRNSEANRPYFDGKEGAGHYLFVHPVDTLITELSEELPSFRVSAR